MFSQIVEMVLSHLTEILLAALTGLLILVMKKLRDGVVRLKVFAAKFVEEAKKTPTKVDDVQGALLTVLATALLAATDDSKKPAVTPKA